MGGEGGKMRVLVDECVNDVWIEGCYFLHI